MREAEFPRLKRLEDFRFDEAPQIPAAGIHELATCAFVDRAENAILLGESRRSHGPTHKYHAEVLAPKGAELPTQDERKEVMRLSGRFADHPRSNRPIRGSSSQR
jgi:hypothetical protein